MFIIIVVLCLLFIVELLESQKYIFSICPVLKALNKIKKSLKSIENHLSL